MNSYLEKALDNLTEGLLDHFQTIGITKGADKKARDYAHVFVPGELYGGKIGTLLCRKPYHSKHVFKRGYIGKDICPKCREVLRELAIVASELHGGRLMELAGPGCHDSFSEEEVGAIIRERSRRKAMEKVKHEKLALFDEAELNVEVKYTPLTNIDIEKFDKPAQFS